jgi:hypothetical protein
VLERAVASLRHWLQRPWDARRVAGWLGAALLATGGALLWWRHGRAWWWSVRGARRRGGADPVRREAGRWLRRMVECRTASGEPREVLAALQRLRYGPRHTWPEPQAVFRRARRTLRTERREVSRW